VPDPRAYKRPVLLALFGLSKATCYWPEPQCGMPGFAMVQGQPVMNLQIAHIHAARPDGPRYRPDMTDEQRRDFSNLIMLCTPHHTYVDKVAPGNFPPETLRQWKADKERDGLGAIRGLTEENNVSCRRAFLKVSHKPRQF
jgi:hypothetical protein